MDETQAVARLKRGDISGLEALVRLYQAQAIEAAYLISRDHAIAEDIVQSAFLRAYERIGSFDASRRFGPWFLRSVVNDALKAVTRRQNVSLDAGILEESEQLASNDPGIYEIFEAAETKEAIWEALDRLSPGQRAVIVMRYYLDLSDVEMAQALDCPPGTVRRRLHDGRQRLRRLLPAWVRGTVEE